VVEDVGYKQFFLGFQKKSPEVYLQLANCAIKYQRVYDTGGYQIYVRRR